ncbi:unnamed protein product [Dicrocoelium dendriticum]|nr:unnamed protein product [Dicrocoelium dendriticum]
MLWHAKALETLSESFNTLQSLHEEADLINFRSTLMRSGSNMTNMPSELQLHRHSLSASGTLYQKPSDLSAHSPRSIRPPGSLVVGDNPHTRRMPSGLPHTSRQRAEDVTSLFSEDEEVSDDGVHSRGAGRSQNSGDHLEDLDDEDSEDDDSEEDDEGDSEYTHTGPTTTASIRKNIQGATSITSQSPLKSALKSSGSKQAA